MTDPDMGPVSFDPSVPGIPDALAANELVRGGAGRVVAFVSDQDHAWASHAVVAIARQWAKDGVRVFLADLGLEDPRLHRVLKIPNREGITDAFRFGASVQRVAHRVGTGSFFFATAGSPTGDPTAVFAHPRWTILVDGFEEAGAALLLFLPAGIPGAAEVLRHATDVVWMAAGAPPHGPLPGTDAELLAWVSPAAEWDEAAASDAHVEWAAEGAEDQTSPEPVESFVPSQDEFGDSLLTGDVEFPFDDEGSAESSVADGAGEAATPELEASEFVPTPPDSTPPMNIQDLKEDGGFLGDSPFAGPAPPRVATPSRKTARPKRRAFSPALAAFGIVSVLAAGGYMAWDQGWIPSSGFATGGGGAAEGPGDVQNPGGTPTPTGEVETPEPPSAELTAEERSSLGAPTSPVLGHSLVVLSESSREAAMARAQSLAEHDGNLLFIVAPSVVNGATWYRVMAGPAQGPDDIPGLRESVSATGQVDGASGWFVRRTNLAFLHAEYASLEAADDRAAELQTLGIPTYVLEVTYESGRSLYRVYSGGYANATEAASLSEHIAAAGDTARLTNRIGSLPR